MKLKHKAKHKRKLEGFRLDFVTALSPAECRSRLEDETALLREQSASKFCIEERYRLPMRVRFNGFGGFYTVRFDGTLQTVPAGTWVRGHIALSTLRLLQLERNLRALNLGFLAYMVLAGVWAAASGKSVSGIGVGVVVCLACMFWLLSRWGGTIEANAQNLVARIRDQLSPIIAVESAFEDIYPPVDSRRSNIEREKYLNNRFSFPDDPDAGVIPSAIFLFILLFLLLAILGGAS